MSIIINNKCCQYAATVALAHEQVKKDLQRITKIKPYIDKYNWDGISYPLKKDDWKKKIERNNLTIALNTQNITQNVK